MSIIDPKYADLPGIAYDQADIYETEDPEGEDKRDYAQEDDSTDSVEKIYIKATEAFDKFKGKSVDGRGIDFCRTLSDKPTLGYNITCRPLGTVDKEDVETPLEKYQRLKYEITELKNEVNSIRDSAKDKEKTKSIADVISLIDKTGEELDAIDVNKFVGKDFLSSVLDYQDFHFKELQSSIELFKQKANLKALTEKNLGAPSTKDTGSGSLKYQMVYFPEKANIQEQTRIASLEKRLGFIESVIGTNSGQIPTSQGIIKTVEGMISKVSLLNSNHLDILDNKITSLLQKLDTVVQKTQNQNSEYEKMLTELYELVKTVENSSVVLPKAVDRMLALNEVHYKAAEVTTDLKHLDGLQSNITKTLETNSNLLREVQKNFGQNLEVLMKDIKNISDRLKKVKA